METKHLTLRNMCTTWCSMMLLMVSGSNAMLLTPPPTPDPGTGSSLALPPSTAGAVQSSRPTENPLQYLQEQLLATRAGTMLANSAGCDPSSSRGSVSSAPGSSMSGFASRAIASLSGAQSESQSAVVNKEELEDASRDQLQLDRYLESYQTTMQLLGRDDLALDEAPKDDGHGYHGDRVSSTPERQAEEGEGEMEMDDERPSPVLELKRLKEDAQDGCEVAQEKIEEGDVDVHMQEVREHEDQQLSDNEQRAIAERTTLEALAAVSAENASDSYKELCNDVVIAKDIVSRLVEEWCGKECKIRPVGSFYTKLGFNVGGASRRESGSAGSDVDLAVVMESPDFLPERDAPAEIRSFMRHLTKRLPSREAGSKEVEGKLKHIHGELSKARREPGFEGAVVKHERERVKTLLQDYEWRVPAFTTSKRASWIASVFIERRTDGAEFLKVDLVFSSAGAVSSERVLKAYDALLGEKGSSALRQQAEEMLLVVKMLLQRNGLSGTAQGGVSGFLLAVLVLHFLRFNNGENESAMWFSAKGRHPLLEFLEYFGDLSRDDHAVFVRGVQPSTEASCKAETSGGLLRKGTTTSSQKIARHTSGRLLGHQWSLPASFQSVAAADRLAAVRRAFANAGRSGDVMNMPVRAPAPPSTSVVSWSHSQQEASSGLVALHQQRCQSYFHVETDEANSLGFNGEPSSGVYKWTSVQNLFLKLAKLLRGGMTTAVLEMLGLNVEIAMAAGGPWKEEGQGCSQVKCARKSSRRQRQLEFRRKVTTLMQEKGLLGRKAGYDYEDQLETAAVEAATEDFLDELEKRTYEESNKAAKKQEQRVAPSRTKHDQESSEKAADVVTGGHQDHSDSDVATIQDAFGSMRITRPTDEAHGQAAADRAGQLSAELQERARAWAAQVRASEKAKRAKHSWRAARRRDAWQNYFNKQLAQSRYMDKLKKLLGTLESGALPPLLRRICDGEKTENGRKAYQLLLAYVYIVLAESLTGGSASGFMVKSGKTLVPISTMDLVERRGNPPKEALEKMRDLIKNYKPETQSVFTTSGRQEKSQKSTQISASLARTEEDSQAGRSAENKRMPSLEEAVRFAADELIQVTIADPVHSARVSIPMHATRNGFWNTDFSYNTTDNSTGHVVRSHVTFRNLEQMTKESVARVEKRGLRTSSGSSRSLLEDPRCSTSLLQPAGAGGDEEVKALKSRFETAEKQLEREFAKRIDVDKTLEELTAVLETIRVVIREYASFLAAHTDDDAIPSLFEDEDEPEPECGHPRTPNKGKRKEAAQTSRREREAVWLLLEYLAAEGEANTQAMQVVRVGLEAGRKMALLSVPVAAAAGAAGVLWCVGTQVAGCHYP